jgi:predicted nucleic acid-binding protein
LILYFDTSALMKLYADEQGATATRAASKTATARFTSMVAYAEMRSAFARKRRFGDITAEKYERYKSEFERDWPRFEALPLDERRARRAGELAEAHGLKGFDAIHLASAEYFHRVLGETTFACFDADLSRAASACGLTLLPTA